MNVNRDMHVAVLMGGWSSEARGFADERQGRRRGAARARLDQCHRGRHGPQRRAGLAELRPDVVFNALHGTPGEDGTVQGMLDLMQIPYTHSGLETSVIAIDKELTKMVLVPHGIRMPEGEVVASESLFEATRWRGPYVLKPVNEGSSVGVAIVTEDSNYGNPIGRDVEGPWLQFDRLLAEPFVKGRELTVAVLGGEALVRHRTEAQGRLLRL